MARNLAGSNADQARQREQRTAWDAYYGRFPKPLKTIKPVDDNVIVNRCRPVVDKMVAFLFGRPVTFSVPDDDAQSYLDAVWAQARQATFLQKLAMNGGVTGQAMIRIVDTQPLPRLLVLDPAMVTVITAANDVDHVTAFILTYTQAAASGMPSDAVQMRQLISEEPDGTWLIADQRNDSGQENGWQQTNLAKWPYPFAPIITCQNLPAPNQWWGLPDLSSDLIQLNNDLNFILSNMARIIRFHAHPKTIGKGFGATPVGTAPDGMLMIPPNADISVLEMHSDLASSMKFADELRQAMDELSRIPSIALGALKDVPKGTISGVALQILYEPLLEKTEVKRSLYGDMLIDLHTRLLTIGGYAPLAPTIGWPNIVPQDEAATLTVAQGMAALGVSKQTIFAKMGLDAAAETTQAALEAAEETARKAALHANAPQQATIMDIAADGAQSTEMAML